MIELSEMIRELCEQLTTALAAGDGKMLRFELGPVEVEASVAVTREAGGDAKVRLWVVDAPDTGVGSGLHVHLSLYDSEEQQPLFGSDGTDLSETALHVIGGLLAAMPDLAPLWAPTANSYKRLTPDTCAPVNSS